MVGCLAERAEDGLYEARSAVCTSLFDRRVDKKGRMGRSQGGVGDVRHRNE